MKDSSENDSRSKPCLFSILTVILLYQFLIQTPLSSDLNLPYDQPVTDIASFFKVIPVKIQTAYQKNENSITRSFSRAETSRFHDAFLIDYSLKQLIIGHSLNNRLFFKVISTPVYALLSIPPPRK
jgi:hypothetical protein